MEATFTKDFDVARSGPLQRQLRKGEYGFFKYSPMLESDFVQISKYGSPVEITNEEEIVTIGISFTNPILLLPDVLLVARAIYVSEEPVLQHGAKIYPQRKVEHELTSRLFPLCLMRISIHDAEKQQLKVKLASGRIFYLQLCPESYRRESLFDSWIRIIQLLWPPSGKMSEIKVIESSRMRKSPPPRPKAPSPKHPVKSTTVWNELAGRNSPYRSQNGEKGRFFLEAQQDSLSHHIRLLGQSQEKQPKCQFPIQREEK
uniref:Uncharacterized protein n=1 Tax=Sphaerodactylus townsendi TaxID=933632 RepID=A0ACB8EUN0_9SAUR